jgi:acyl carrier protein
MENFIKVEELVATVMNVPLSLITDATGPTTLQTWNSLKHLELIAALEEVYGIKLTTHEMHRLTCVADIRNILQQRSPVIKEY